MSEKAFYYSNKYTDYKYEYRHVMLPKDLAKLVPKTHLMSETEWRNLGVQQGLGWVHYMLHEPEPHILLFRRQLIKNKLQRAVATKPSKKRLRIPSSDDKYVLDRQVNVDGRGDAGSSLGSSKSSASHSLIGKKVKKDEKGVTSFTAAYFLFLIQDMKDNFKELAETQLQCAVCLKFILKD